ncbi:MAG: rhodanese-like domain-containing protein [Saprospiraceae bacterium]|nr:rhodanese-like domain-containing protein [Saprospiraceae bacterium]
MRFLTLVFLLTTLFACQNQPAGDPQNTGVQADTTQNTASIPGSNTTPAPRSSPYVFTDTILVSIGAKDFAAVVNEKRNMAILDFRTPQEFKKGHVWRSINMDATGKTFMDDLMKLSRKQEYAVYCKFGDVSLKIAEEMKLAGFKRIYHLQNGLMRWGESGQALQLK